MPALRYVRNYAALALVGRTILDPAGPPRFLASRPMRYIAEISFALYLIHSLATRGWLGSGDKVVRSAKRPLTFAICFALSHASTFYYERPWIARGKRWAKAWDRRARPTPAPGRLGDVVPARST